MDLVVVSASDIKLNDNVLFELEIVSEKYAQYIQKLQELEERRLRLFLTYLKDREVVDNQETEYEDEFMIGLELLTKRKTSIDMVMELYKKGLITIEDVRKLHKQVIKGSSDDLQENYDFRSTDDIWVGSVLSNGERDVHYHPPISSELKDILQEILNYLNAKGLNINISDIFIRPFIVHALIAYLQPFGNGNTRLARVLQHGKMHEMTNEVFDTNFEKPALYLSKNYLNTRFQYRDLIKKIAMLQNSEAWNAWILYNLYMSEEQINYLDQRVR